MQQTKKENYRLYWVCNKTGRKHPAGVAFYNEPKGDFRLKIDTMPEDKNIFLKVASSVDGIVYYRVETAVKKGSAVSHRAEIGTGRAKLEEGFPIVMDIGPFDRNLVMEKSE